MCAYSAIHKAKGWFASGLNGPFTACLVALKVTFSQASVCLQGVGGEGSHVTITHGALSTYPTSTRRGTYRPPKRRTVPSLFQDIGPTPSLPGNGTQVPTPSPDMGPWYLPPYPSPSPLDMVPSPLLASDGHPWKSVQTCSLEDLPLPQLVPTPSDRY